MWNGVSWAAVSNTSGTAWTLNIPSSIMWMWWLPTSWTVCQTHYGENFLFDPGPGGPNHREPKVHCWVSSPCNRKVILDVAPWCVDIEPKLLEKLKPHLITLLELNIMAVLGPSHILQRMRVLSNAYFLLKGFHSQDVWDFIVNSSKFVLFCLNLRIHMCQKLITRIAHCIMSSFCAQV